MSLLIKSNIHNLKKIGTSNKFIKYIFSLPDYNGIDRQDSDNDNNIIYINKKYDVNDIDNYSNISDTMKKNIKNNLSHIEVFLSIKQEIIKYNENTLILKYTINITKPEYIKSIISDTKVIYYAKFTLSEKEPDYVLLNYSKKFLNNDCQDNDEFILNESNNIISNMYDEENKIEFNKMLISLAITVFGEELINNIAIPFIHNLFDELIKSVLNVRLKKYLVKKNYDIYKKK